MSSPVRTSFGTWLLERRRQAGITQDELAEQIGCAPITLQKIVSGKRRPSRQIALLLADYFGVPEDEQEAFVTFARASIPTSAPAPGISSPESGTGTSGHPADLINQTTQAPANSSRNAPWRAVHLSKSNLPLVLTTLIGREHELDEVCSILAQRKVRLMTVTGSPGTGKTSLSIEVASTLMGDFEDGVYLVELGLLSDPAMVIYSIAHTLDLSETAGRSIEETLLAYIKDKRILLVLDNFEHLLDAGHVVVKLVQASPWLKVLITSREALHVRGERQYPLPPLTLPLLTDRSGHKLGLEELARNPAVQLFVERARSMDTNFALTEENALDVAKVCVNLDGLPLAIELAAARVSLFPPRILLSRLGQQLKVLTGGSRDLPARQRTLRGAIAWSYDLLDEGHQQLFRRMAVFWGGRTLQSLEAVCNSASLQVQGKKRKVEVLDGVETLLSSNLVQQREGRDGEPRFWMLETIHEYAKEKLEESGEAQILQREHARYFMRFAERVEPHLTGGEQQEWLEGLEDEHDNLRAALAWCVDQGQRGSEEGAEIGLRMAGAIWRFWYVRCLLREGREQMEKVLSLPEGVLHACSSSSRARVLHGAAALAWRQADYSEARSLLERALALGREGGDKQSISFSLYFFGNVAYEQGDYSGARALYEESLVLRRELGDKWGIANSLDYLGLVVHEQGDYSGARALLEESLALQMQIGDMRGVATSQYLLGLVASSQGVYAGARALYEESLALFRELEDKASMALLLSSLGIVAAQQGQYTGARALFKESLALQMQIGDMRGIAESISGLGVVAVGMGHIERGAKLLAAVRGLLRNIGTVLDRDDRVPYERAVASAQVVLGEEAFERALREGLGMSLEEAVEYALEGATPWAH